MSALCPSCREPIDYPSGDGCAAMDKHMTNYYQTRTASGKVVSRFANTLRNLEDDWEEEVVIQSLVNYHRMCSKPDKIDNTDEYIEPDEDLLWAIERILQDFMTLEQYSEWKKVKRKTALDELAKVDQEDGLI